MQPWFAEKKNKKKMPENYILQVQFEWNSGIEQKKKTEKSLKVRHMTILLYSIIEFYINA